MTFLKSKYIVLVIAALVLGYVLLQGLLSNNVDVSANKVRSEFIQKAESENWYILDDSGLFQPISYAPKLFGIPAMIGQTSVLKLGDSLSLKDTSFSPDKRFMVTNSYARSNLQDPPFVSPHLTIFDISDNFSVVYSSTTYSSLLKTPNGSSSGYAWSPDGKYIAFVQDTKLQLLDTKTYQVKTITSDHAANTEEAGWWELSPLWLDANTIIYQDEQDSIQQIDINTQEKSMIVKGMYPSLSPDKTRLVFLTGNRHRGEYNVYDFSTKKVTGLFKYDSGQVVSWTPDSNYLLLMANSGDGSDETNVYDFTTKTLVTLAYPNETQFLQGKIYKLPNDLTRQLVEWEDKDGTYNIPLRK